MYHVTCMVRKGVTGMGKKIIGFLLTFIICIGVLPVTTLADSAKPVIKNAHYVNISKDSIYSIEFTDSDSITMADVFLIGPEIKEGQDVSALTIVLNGKTYPVYAMSPIDLEKSNIASGSWKVTNKTFAELDKAPAAGKKAGLVIGTCCDGDENLTFSDICWFKVPKLKIKLTLKKVTVRKSKDLKITATLKLNGKVAKGKRLGFWFNGKTYKAKTNSKGVAKITIKKNKLKKFKVGKKVTYKVTYGSKTVKKKVKVKK